MLILLRFELVAIRILGILELGQVISRGVLAQQILDIGLEFESAHLDKLIAVWVSWTLDVEWEPQTLWCQLMLFNIASECINHHLM